MLLACQAEPPVIARFDADPSLIDRGGTSRLRWEVSGASDLSITASGISVAQSEAPSGQVDVSPEKTTAYVLVARNQGVASSASVKLVVRQPAEVISFGISPNRLRSGERAILGWTTRYAGQVLVSDGTDWLPIDPALTEGTADVFPRHSTTYVLVARGEATEATAQASVEVVPPPHVVAFTATPEILGSGEKTTLAWEVAGADEVKIVDGTGRTLPMGKKATTDSYQTAPAATTTFTLTATGYGGQSQATRRVQVRPTITSFTADPVAQAPGGPVTLSWRTKAATRVEVVDQAGRKVTEALGALALEGSFQDAIPATAEEKMTYRLTAYADDLSEAKSLEVLVGPAPTIVSYTVNANPAPVGSQPVLAWETRDGTLVRIYENGTRLTTITSLPRVAQGTYTAPAIAAQTTYLLEVESSKKIRVSQPMLVRVIAPAPPRPGASGPVRPGWTFRPSDPGAGERMLLEWWAWPTLRVEPRPFFRGQAPFRSIAAIGTKVLVADGPAPLDFPSGFRILWGGVPRRTVQIGADGAVFFERPGASGPRELVAAYRGALDPGSGGVFAEVAGPGPSLIVSWERVGIAGLEGLASFQVEIAPDGRVEVRWGELPGLAARRVAEGRAQAGLVEGGAESWLDGAAIGAGLSAAWETAWLPDGKAEITAAPGAIRLFGR